MNLHIEYGRDGIDIELPGDDATVLRPTYFAGLKDEAAAFRHAVREPIGTGPLKEQVGADERVAVVVPDITRPCPSDRILPWLFEELSHVPAERITVVVGTGSHRTNTPQELATMLGDDIVARYTVVNHESRNADTLRHAGTMPDSVPVRMNRAYVQADRRIVIGFIEPHFMAGFSGGYKGIFPAVADIDAIMHYHRAEVIGDERSTWGRLEDNPTQALVRACGSLLSVDFCINVTLNRDRGITGFFCGDVMQAHKAGCRRAKDVCMAPCNHTFDLVVTTNGGYPLDQNLYQTVKGMSAAAQVVTPGGTIVTAARCNDGFPSHGNFRKLLFEHESPQALLDTIMAPDFSMYDQWEAQLLAQIQLKAHVALYSELPAEEVRQAHIEPVDDLNGTLARIVETASRDLSIAVLPEGPMTIPYLAQNL